MPPKKSPKPKPKETLPGSPPPPYKPAPDLIQKLFTPNLDPAHIYIAHLDHKPAAFKRKIFLVPLGMNVAVFLLFLWRVNYILPYYLQLLMSGFGHPNETTIDVANESWWAIAWEVGRRTVTFLLDFGLGVFVWPWPAEFFLGRAGNPVWWRWRVGFRDREIYVRRSREWDSKIGDAVENATDRQAVLGLIRQATSSSLIADKTGYLTMSGHWDLDWAAMVHAHELVDQKLVAMDAFRCLVLLYHENHGWLAVDLGIGENAKEEDRRRQVFAFRDALVAVDKEDLFFRWIEVVQFESTRPGGFSEERQEEVAKNIREMFAEEDIDFDELWRESVGSEAMAGI